MKKIVSLLIVLAMLMVMAPAVFAADVTGSGTLDDPYVYESVDALVSDWTGKTVSDGAVVYVEAPIGGETITVTSDTTAAAIQSTMGASLAFDSEPYDFSQYYADGDVVTIGIYNQNPYGPAVVTLTAGSASVAGDSVLLEETITASSYDEAYAGIIKYLTIPGAGTVVIEVSNGYAEVGFDYDYSVDWIAPTTTYKEYAVSGAGTAAVIVCPMDSTMYYAAASVDVKVSFVASTGVAADPLSVGTAAAPANNNVEAADCAWSYTAAEDGILHLTMGNAVMGPVDATYSVNGGDAVALPVNSFADVEMAANEEIVINVTASGYATLRAGWEAAAAGVSAAPLNVDIAESPAYNSINAADCAWSYTATEDGTLTLNIGGAVAGPVEVTYSVNGGAATALALNSTVDVDMAADDEIVINVTASGYATLKAGWTAGDAVSGPAALNVGTAEDVGLNSINAVDCAWSYTATEDGILTLNIGGAVAGPVDVTYSVNGAAATTLALSSTADIEMAANDEIVINVTASGYATLKASWGAPAASGNSVASATNQSVAADAPIEIPFTPEADGTLTVVISGTPGYSIKVEDSLNGTVGLPVDSGLDKTLTYDLVAGEAYTIVIGGFSTSAWEATNATVTYSISFEAKEIEIPKDDKDKSTTELALGENNVDLLETAIVTLYDFVPAEAGTYKFTVTGDVTMAQYGYAAWNLIETAENGVFEIEATAAEQTIMIGLSGDVTSANVKVEKVADYVAPAETTYLDYEATVEVDDTFEMPEGTVVSVDITEAQNVVLGNDGYYHLGTYEGPILYVNLNSEGFNLAGLYDAGAPITMRGEKFTGEDGKLYCYDYMNMITGSYYYYSQDGNYYPMNADLMAFMQDYGTAQGWYIQGLSGFSAINEGGFEEDSAWLVTAVYIEGNNGSATAPEGGNTGNEGGNTGNEGGNTGNQGGNTGNQGGTATGNPEPPKADTGDNSKTGDFGIIAAAIALGMSAIGGTAVIAKKKEN